MTVIHQMKVKFVFNVCKSNELNISIEMILFKTVIRPLTIERYPLELISLHFSPNAGHS